MSRIALHLPPLLQLLPLMSLPLLSAAPSLPLLPSPLPPLLLRRLPLVLHPALRLETLSPLVSRTYWLPCTTAKEGQWGGRKKRMKWI